MYEFKKPFYIDFNVFGKSNEPIEATVEIYLGEKFVRNLIIKSGQTVPINLKDERFVSIVINARIVFEINGRKYDSGLFEVIPCKMYKILLSDKKSCEAQFGKLFNEICIIEMGELCPNMHN